MNLLTVKKNEKIATDTYKMTLDSTTKHKAGQFVEIKVNNTIAPFLRRPISVSDSNEDGLTIVYKVFGSGTDILSKVSVGEEISCLEDLGNGFSLTADSEICLVGGGIGVPPLLLLAKELKKQGKKITTVLGFSTKDDVFYEEELSQYSDVYITTLDGSYGIKGNVLDVMKDVSFSYYYAVGPTGMLKAIKKTYPKGQLSLEERMGCGFGACMGCSIMTKIGPKRVCVDGPVFDAEVLSWED